MPDFDIKADKVPQNGNKPPVGPTIAGLKSALSTYNSTSYSAARLLSMTKTDLIYAARLHGLSVNGL